jgi:hypothetical protein
MIPYGTMPHDFVKCEAVFCIDTEFRSPASKDSLK